MTVTHNDTNPATESDIATKLNKEQEPQAADLVVETPPTTNDSTTTAEDVVVAAAMASTSAKANPKCQNQKKKLSSKLNVDRCVVCFKLVKNLKGNRLCQYYDLSSAYPVVSKSGNSRTATSSFDYELNSNHDSSSQHDLLGEPSSNGPLDLNNNHVNSHSRNINSKNSSDLVKEPVEEDEAEDEEEAVETSNQVINKKSQLLYENNPSTLRTIGDVVYESVKTEKSQQLLAKNSACLKKICEACYRHVCLIDYHIKSAEQIMDLVGLKVKKSNGLLTGQASSLRVSRALSACSSRVAAAESLIGDGVSGDLVDLLRSQNELRLFNKRKVIDARNSSQNTLAKVAKNESSPKLTTINKVPDANNIRRQSSADKIPINNFTNIANNLKASNNTNHTNNSNGNIFDQSLRNSTISHIQNLLKNADPQTLSQMQRLAQSASLLQNGFVKSSATDVKQANSMNLNHNFKSINNNNNNNHSNNNNNNNVSSFTAFNNHNNKSVNFNKNAPNANQEAKASRNDLSDMSESSYKSNQYEQKQQEQEMGSRRKRKSINPSRLMKDNTTNEVDANKISGDQANFAKKGNLLQNGHSAFERRHHSADSFQHQHHQAKLMNSQKTTGFKGTSTAVQQGNKGRQHNNNYRAKKMAIDYESQLDSIDQSAQALLLLSEKENDKLNGLLFSHQEKQRQGQDEENDGEAGSDKRGVANGFIEQNGINCDVDDEEDANEHLMNESEHDLSEVSAVGGNYIHDDEDEDEHHLTMDPDETDTNEIDIDIDEVEADAEDDDELDENEQDTEDDEDCGSVENDENQHQYHNGFHSNNNNNNNNKQNSSNLKRQKLDLTNGSNINHNKLTKKIFNIKNELYKNNIKNSASNMLNRQNNMSEFNQQRHIGGAAGRNFGFNNNNNNNNSHKNQQQQQQQQQARFSKNGHGGANAVKASKKFSVKSESLSRNMSNNNGSYYNHMNYDESSNHSKSNQNFVSPSLSDSPSPSQMADIASPHSRSLNSSYLSCNNGGSHGNTKHACEVCKKTFKTQNILRQHMRIHTGDKPFVCDICTKAFSQMASLKYHLATHSDARPYRCEVCSKTFKLKPPFKKHIKECQPKLGAAASHQAYHHQQASSPSGSQFNYFNSGQFNVNSNGLELDANEDDID